MFLCKFRDIFDLKELTLKKSYQKGQFSNKKSIKEHKYTLLIPAPSKTLGSQAD